ncbi:hypothetical protein ACH5RR_003167 [Cinchona calisaya]|uniref:CCHC-type domain-containing protein n=1 Tax=Cinchona calisaya TaxID=153742 RepID=A0ABD3AU22_9GENT
MGHISNGMSDGLFDTYQDAISAKDLWERLEARHMREDATSNKFLVSRFNNYKMVDGKLVMEQLYEIENLLNNFKQHKMNMDETIIVSSIIDKLSPSWKDFKRSLNYKKEDISLEQLGHKLRLEEECRNQQDTKDNVQEGVHITEDGKTKSHKKRSQHSNNSSKNKVANKKKKGNCFFCGKAGHYRVECRLFKM